MLNLTKMRSLLDARLPGHTLPQGCYTDPEVFAFDLAAIFARNWILAGFEAELPAPGCTLSVPIGRASVLLVRDRQGGLRGFHNTCRHRGAELCAPGRGQRSWIICPYHQWTYDLDGRLANAPRMPDGVRPRAARAAAGPRGDRRRLHLCLPGGGPAGVRYVPRPARPAAGAAQPGERQARVRKHAGGARELEAGDGERARVLPLRGAPSRAVGDVSGEGAPLGAVRRRGAIRSFPGTHARGRPARRDRSRAIGGRRCVSPSTTARSPSRWMASRRAAS